MFTLRRSKRFARKLKKIIKADKSLAEKFLLAFQQLEENPSHPALRTHKVIDADGQKSFSSYVTSDLRIIWDYADDESDLLDLIDVGGHSGGKKIYS